MSSGSSGRGPSPCTPSTSSSAATTPMVVAATRSGPGISVPPSTFEAASRRMPRCRRSTGVELDARELANLRQPDVVSGGVAERGVDPVGLFLGLVDELDAAALQLVEVGADVVGREE